MSDRSSAVQIIWCLFAKIDNCQTIQVVFFYILQSIDLHVRFLSMFLESGYDQIYIFNKPILVICNLKKAYAEQIQKNENENETKFEIH